jgi:hypothetical protein
MNKNCIGALALGAFFSGCSYVWATGYAISPFPANSVLGPDGPVAIPSAINQLLSTYSTVTVNAVNTQGQMAITASNNSVSQPGAIYAYLPSAADGLSAGLNFISYTQWAAFAINNNGQIAGSNGDNWEAWNLNGSAVPLGSGVAAGLAGVATGINDSGQTIMQDFEQGNIGRVYVYSAMAENGYAVGMTNLTPSGSDYTILLAIGINNYGDALYDSAPATYYDNPSVVYQAYLHTGSAHNGLIGSSNYELSGPGWSMYQAVGLNNAGQVVGMVNYVSRGRAFDDPALWTINNGILDLNSLLPANSGWILQTVTGIDQLGDIEGMGLYNGVSTPFILSLPEPASVAMSLIAVTFVSHRRSRR